MSHGIRIRDIAWQAFQAGLWSASSLPVGGRRHRIVQLEPSMVMTDAGMTTVNAEFTQWWDERVSQGAALPECEKCGFDAGLKLAHVWILKLSKDPSSLNAHIHNAGHTRYAYAKERDEWHWLIKHERLKQKIPKAIQRRRVTLTRQYAGRRKERDIDNLSGGMKSCVDAIVREGLLVNDSPQYAELHYKQNRVSERSSSGLWIQIEEFA